MRVIAAGRHRSALALLTLLTLGAGWLGLLSGCGAEPPPPDPTAAQLVEVEAELASLLAASRTESGLPPLSRDDALDDVARAWSEQLAAVGELAHNPSYAEQIPDGWSESGENVGWIDPADHPLEDLPDALHEAWLDSPSHRANIEDPAYSAVGIGVAYDPEHGYYVTQDFAGYRR